MELSDFTNTYPARSDSDYQERFNETFEFASLVFDPNESLGKTKPSFFSHQRLAHRQLMRYRRAMFTDEPGTGKTCKVEGFTEIVADIKENARLDPSAPNNPLANVGEIFIMCKNLSVVQEVKYQLVCKCSDGRYVPDASTYLDLNRAARQNIEKAGYRVSTYNDFVVGILARFGYSQDPDSGENFRKQFLVDINNPEMKLRDNLVQVLSNCIFWIDEAHNLVNSDDENKIGGSEFQTINYKIIHKIFSVVKNSYIILTTATPSINRFTEFFKVANLVIDHDGVMPDSMEIDKINNEDFAMLFPELPDRNLPRHELAKYYKPQFPDEYVGGDYYGNLSGRRMNLEFAPDEVLGESTTKLLDVNTYNFIRVRMKGIISTVRTFFKDFRKVVKVGNVNNLPYNTGRFISLDELYPVKLSREHTDYYNNVEKGNINAISGRLQRISIFVYPTSRSDIKGFSPEPDTKAYKTHFDDRGRLREDSSLNKIFANDQFMYRRGAKLLESKRLISQYKGLVVVSLDNVKGSGCRLAAEYYAKVFDLDHYDGKDSMLNEMLDVDRSYCSEQKDSNIVVQERRRSSVAIIDGSTPPAALLNIKNAASHISNIDGKLIRIVIITKAASEGISLLGAEAAILINPKWTVSAKQQSEARAIRTDSYTKKGPILEARAGHKLDLTIDVYRLVSLKNAGSETIDVQMYRGARLKAIDIFVIRAYCEMISNTCVMNLERNRRPTDVDYSEECNYMKCYKPCEKKPVKYDYTGYDNDYADDDLDTLIDRISKVFIMNSHLTLQQIIEQFPDERPHMIGSAVIEMVKKKIPINDKFGIVAYLKEDGDTFVTDREYPEDVFGTKLSHHYTDEINSVQLKDVAQIAEEMANYTNSYLMSIFSFNYVQSYAFTVRSSIYAKVKFLELYVKLAHQGKLVWPNNSGMKPFFDEQFRKFVYAINEPIKDMNILDQNIKSPEKAAGRPITTDLENGFTGRLLDNKVILQKNPDPTGTKVYFHTLYGQKAPLSKNSLSPNFIEPPAESRIRIYRPEIDQDWRDATPLETAIYRKIAHIANINTIIDLAGGIDNQGRLKTAVGMKLADGTVKIVESNSAKGKACKNRRKLEILDLVSRNGLVDRKRDPNENNMGKTQLTQLRKQIGKLINVTDKELLNEDLEISPSKLLDYQQFLNDNTGAKGDVDVSNTKEGLCDEVYNLLKRKGKVLLFAKINLADHKWEKW